MMKIKPKEELFAVMLSKGLTQQDLSKKTGLTYVTINKAFNNKGISAKTAKEICNAMDVNFEDIFFISNDNKCYQMNDRLSDQTQSAL